MRICTNLVLDAVRMEELGAAFGGLGVSAGPPKAATVGIEGLRWQRTAVSTSPSKDALRTTTDISPDGNASMMIYYLNHSPALSGLPSHAAPAKIVAAQLSPIIVYTANHRINVVSPSSFLLMSGLVPFPSHQKFDSDKMKFLSAFVGTILLILAAAEYATAAIGGTFCSTPKLMCVTATQVGSNTIYNLSTTVSRENFGWMAVGFGDRMVGTPAVVVWPNSDDTITLAQRKATAHASPPIDPAPPRTATLREDLSTLTGTPSSVVFYAKLWERNGNNGFCLWHFKS
ncbi:cellobiose dehydrogenase [Rhizoctonia solani]|uniref:Cellobiose dehydrogenase n=1 Tax=Rhizoctonia solani TaxID=456999 RepID=A0A8H8SSW8_9AGAM|nr:cellobiose dehydrogenase [Rhizoctonia solani]QRW15657.1 cellobiose dehydrogenase [Rhizoctonia solani]